MAASRKPRKTGPKPETLKIEGSWKDAVAYALKRGNPAKARPKAKQKKQRKLK